MLIVVLWKEDRHSVHSDKVQSLKSVQKRYSSQPCNTLSGEKKAKTWKVDGKHWETCGLMELINYSIWPKTSTLRKLLTMFYRVQHRSTHLCTLFSVTLEAALTSRYQSNRQRAGIGQKKDDSTFLLHPPLLPLFLAIMFRRLSLLHTQLFQWKRCRRRHLKYHLTN